MEAPDVLHIQPASTPSLVRLVFPHRWEALIIWIRLVLFVGPLTALWLIAVFPGKYPIVFALTLLPGIAAAALIGLVVQEKKRAPVPHASFSERLYLLPRVYRRLLFAVGIFGAGAFAHTLLILWAAQRLTPALGASVTASLVSISDRRTRRTAA